MESLWTICFRRLTRSLKSFLANENQCSWARLSKPINVSASLSLTWPSLSLSAFDRKPSQIFSITSWVSVFLSLPAGHPRRSQIFCDERRKVEKWKSLNLRSLSIKSFRAHLNCYLEIFFVNFAAVIYVWGGGRRSRSGDKRLDLARIRQLMTFLFTLADNTRDQKTRRFFIGIFRPFFSSSCLPSIPRPRSPDVLWCYNEEQWRADRMRLTEKNVENIQKLLLPERWDGHCCFLLASTGSDQSVGRTYK